jgi:hypothetical protein
MASTEVGKSVPPLDLTDPLIEKLGIDAKELIKPEPINPLPPVISIEVGMTLFCARFFSANMVANNIKWATL